MTRRAQRKPAKRRKPTQLRAQTTVAAMLEAVVRLLKQGGISAITTNRIAEKAGVSIGSVYQYFPNKQAIFIALHEKHIREVDGVIRRKIEESMGEPLDRFISALIDGMIDPHRRSRTFDSARFRSAAPGRWIAGVFDQTAWRIPSGP